MNKKKLYLNIIFQISVIVIVSVFFITNQLEFSKINFLLSSNIVSLFILIFFLKFFISCLFFFIVNIIAKKKGHFLEITNTFLQGGLVNMLIPGIGLIYKYYKFKINSNISLAEYSVSQSISSLSSILSFSMLAILFGFIQIIIINMTNLIFFSVILCTLIFFLYYNKNNIYSFLIKNLLKIKRINSLYLELQSIKKIILDYKLNFLYIFIGFIILSILQCFAFYKALDIFGYDLDFFSSSFIYISSILVSVLSMINVIGFFELALSISASFITENYIDMIIVGLGFRILNTSALIMVIIINSIINLILYYKSRKLDRLFK